MAAVWLSVAQASVIASSAVVGPDFVSLDLYDQPQSYARHWRAGEVLVTQGDVYVQVGVDGPIKGSVPFPAAGLC